MYRPKNLKKGDTIGIVAPSGPMKNKSDIDKAIKFLLDMGFKIKEGKYIRESYGFLASKDDNRVSDLHEMFLDKDVNGILCIRGGYGTPRIADKIDINIIKNNPKLFMGYSDITTLHILFNQKANLITYHGPMFCDFVSDDYLEFSHESFKRSIFASEPLGLIQNPDGYPIKTLNNGVVRGQIVGGNLTLIARTLGTKHEIDTKNKILFIEDVGEEPYHVDGYLSHLKNCGKLDDCIGFIVGDFAGSEPVNTDPSFSMDEVIDLLITSTGKPAIANFRAGHCEPKITFPLGADIELDATNKKVIFF